MRVLDVEGVCLDPSAGKQAERRRTQTPLGRGGDKSNPESKCFAHASPNLVHLPFFRVFSPETDCSEGGPWAFHLGVSGKFFSPRRESWVPGDHVRNGINSSRTPNLGSL